MNETEVFYPTSLAEWRKWLAKNHLSQQSVWLVFHSKSSKKPSITWSEAVDVALCFGWIDSKKIKIDHETSHQFFSKRKPNSTWSKINKVFKQLPSQQNRPFHFFSKFTQLNKLSEILLEICFVFFLVDKIRFRQALSDNQIIHINLVVLASFLVSLQN